MLLHDGGVSGWGGAKIGSDACVDADGHQGQTQLITLFLPLACVVFSLICQFQTGLD